MSDTYKHVWHIRTFRFYVTFNIPKDVLTRDAHCRGVGGCDTPNISKLVENRPQKMSVRSPVRSPTSD